MLFTAIRNVDVVVYRFLNGFAGNQWLDHLANFEENSNLLKGGLFLAAYWYVWFSPGPDQDKRRKSIVAILAGALVALAISRILADLAPYRVRPMYDPTLTHHLHSFPISLALVDWSSFPSDNATLFFGLAFGLGYLVRRLAIPAMIYTAVWICLPRMFLGEHYASDIVAGAAVGIAVVWLSLNVNWIQNKLATRVLRMVDSRPQVFYPIAFVASFEISILFDDVRRAARAGAHFVTLTAQHGILSAALAAVVAICLAALTARLVFVGRRRPNSFREDRLSH